MSAISLVTKGMLHPYTISEAAPPGIGLGGGAGLAHRQEMVFPKINIKKITLEKSKKGIDDLIEIKSVKFI